MNISTKNQLLNEDRRHFVGGSDARIIMGKDEKALFQLWKEKRGEVPSPDLSGELIVQLGMVTENLNRRWYERNAGHQVVGVQNRLFHRSIPWMAASLDGLVKETGAVFEAKFMLLAAVSRHVALNPEKVIVRMDRGETVSTLEVDIELPNGFDKRIAVAS